MRTRRPGLTLFQLLVALAILAILLGLLLPAIQRVRVVAARMESSNNLKQIGLGCHTYNDVHGHLPAGVDANHFSAAARLLPYLEQANLFKRIDFNKACDDKANAEVASVLIKTYVSPRDPVQRVRADAGSINYLFNQNIFFLKSKTNVYAIPDGASNTILTGETLKGDGRKKGVDVRRQYVLLKKADLKGLKDDAGVKLFKADKNIAGDRCDRWIDGRFLKGTFNGRLRPNDARPDVSCAGEGGVSALRSLDRIVLVGLADGSVLSLSTTIGEKTWRAGITPAGGEVIDLYDQ
jgi:type II secretory pathway pseudopilin PulG